jgi:hypothetical protein
MNQASPAQIMAAIERLAESVKHMTLGLIPNPRDTEYLYLNRQHESVWYKWVDGEAVIPEAGALRGIIQKVEIKTKHRRGSEVEKLVVWVQGDVRYGLEIPFNDKGESSSLLTARSFIGALSTMTAGEIQQPITIQPYPGDEDPMALFVGVYDASGQSRYNFIDKSDLRQAVATVQGLLGQDEESAHATHQPPRQEEVPNTQASPPPQETPQQSDTFPGENMYSQFRDLDLSPQVTQAAAALVRMAGTADPTQPIGGLDTEKGTLAQRIAALAKHVGRSDNYMKRIGSLYGVRLSEIPASEVGNVVDMIHKESVLHKFETGEMEVYA